MRHIRAHFVDMASAQRFADSIRAYTSGSAGDVIVRFSASLPSVVDILARSAIDAGAFDVEII